VQTDHLVLLTLEVSRYINNNNNNHWRCSWNFLPFSACFSSHSALQCCGISGLIRRGRRWC